MDKEAELAESFINPAQLRNWMDSRQLGSGPISEFQILSGGTQNILLMFDRAGRRYVLRRPPVKPRPESNQTMRREAQVLRALGSSSVPHARLIAACEDEAVFGFAFYLMEPVAGYNATERLPAEAHDPQFQREMGFALVDALATLGQVNPWAVGLEGFGKVEGFLERQVGRWKKQLDSYAQHEGWAGPDTLPGVNHIADWLAANCPKTFFPGILHGDFHLANVMFARDTPKVAAIVDWELATLGDPLLDLGWLLATWPRPDGSGGAFDIRPWDGFPTAEELVERYRQQSTRNLDAIDWYEVLACYKLGILQEGTMARAQAGLAPKETGEHLHRLAVQLFERAQKRIAARSSNRHSSARESAADRFKEAPQP
nr:phosphotransferase family protein [Sphingomonas sp. CDS-1]